MWKADLTEMRTRYQQRFAQFGHNRKTLGWDKDCQNVRFAAVFEGLRDEDYGSIIDVGCGFGDLLTYLRRRGWRGFYTGIDLVPELIVQAEQVHKSDPLSNFESVDITNQRPSSLADLAVAIGIFNHRLRQPQGEYVREMIDAMWNLSGHTVVCDFLSTSSEPERRRDDLFYADPKDAFDIGSQYSRRIMLHHSYMPFEFQLKMWHDDGYTEALPVFPPFSGGVP